MTSYTDIARDNQWWYSKHPLSEDLDDLSSIVLVVNGRRCAMTHSRRGRDGRVTRSFRFDAESDRNAWIALRGRALTIEVEGASGARIERKDGTIDRTTPPRHSLMAPLRLERRRTESTAELPTIRKTEIVGLFDAYLFCDWSAGAEPRTGVDSIWLADGWFERDGTFVWGVIENPSTRRVAEDRIRDRILRHGSSGRRTLVGIDFPFGYPASSLQRVVGDASAQWRDLWRMLERRIQDDPNNSNNRFAVASAINNELKECWYWGCATQTETLSTRKGDGSNRPEFRLVEANLRAAGRHPFSVWQLYGNGSVGSQSLVGLPVCERLRADEVLRLRVWPFETSFAVPDRSSMFNVLAEVWPGAIDVDHSLHPVKDAAQMRSLVRWAAEQDSAGTLGRSFEVPTLLGSERVTAEKLEGWILGWMG